MAELVEDANQKGAKGIFSTARFFMRAAKILTKVISRFIDKRDHGVYTTVVEEILRELYIANIGAIFYGVMKKETSDTFDRSAPGRTRGGRYFVEQFGEMLKDIQRIPDVTVVAHSLGSVFACNLIHHLAESRADNTLPKEFKLKNLIFLAPAVEYKVFADTLNQHRNLFDYFWMFALQDQYESGYWEVDFIYPRSLLYMVSGLFEKQDSGEGAFDRPLVGMERYYTRNKVYTDSEILTVRDFINKQPEHTIWAVVEDGPGLLSDAREHGDFDETKFEQDQENLRKTIMSILRILREKHDGK